MFGLFFVYLGLEDLELAVDLFVDDRERNSYFADVPFDYLAFFGQDPRFARIWSDYVWVAEEVDFDIYRRRCAPDC